MSLETVRVELTLGEAYRLVEHLRREERRANSLRDCAPEDDYDWDGQLRGVLAKVRAVAPIRSET